MEYHQENLFGGSGVVKVHDLLNSSPAPPFKAVLWCSLEPNGAVGTHIQEQFSQIVTVLQGEGVAVIDGVGQDISRGVVIHLPLGSTLALSNSNSRLWLDYLIVKAEPQ